MQYKIPIQIENEDVIVANLSLRQLSILMVWGGLGYVIFKKTEATLGAEVGIILALPFILFGVVVALMKISEMTFLPAALNFFRLTLNAKERAWSQGTDGYSDLDVGYVVINSQKAAADPNQSIETRIEQDADINANILKL
jgi:PrgI family protein